MSKLLVDFMSGICVNVWVTNDADVLIFDVLTLSSTISLQSANNGIEPEVKPSESVERIAPRVVDDVDGIPLDDVDGVPLSDMDGSVFKDDLDGSPYKPNNTPLLKSSAAISALQGYDDDDDEDDDIDGAPRELQLCNCVMLYTLK
jgi:hypothetical protein